MWFWGMTKALGLVAILSTGVALIILSIDLPSGNDTASMLGGAILLSLGLDPRGILHLRITAELDG